jgi:hypothetical protein
MVNPSLASSRLTQPDEDGGTMGFLERAPGDLQAHESTG